MTDTRKALSDAIDRWERWAAGEMFIAEHLHPRARARLLDDLEAIAPATGGTFGRIVDERPSINGYVVGDKLVDMRSGKDEGVTFTVVGTTPTKPKGKKAGA